MIPSSAPSAPSTATRTVRRLKLTGPGTIAWAEEANQPPGPKQVQVRCEQGAEKHGTMAAFYKGYANQRGRWDGAWRMHRPGEGDLWSYPLPLGNMAVGRVTALGPEVEGFAVGDRVLCYAAFGTVANAGTNRTWKIADDLPWQSAVCLDPAVFALGAIRDGHIRMGDTIAVFGLGAIGLCAVQLARSAGATVIAVDPVAERRAIAASTGAVATLGEAGEDVGRRLKELTNGRGVDAIIDFSGAVPALQAALRGIGYLGTIVMGAFPAPHSQGLDFGGEAHMNRPHLVFSRACSDPNPEHPRWNEDRLLDEAMKAIAAGRLDGRPLVGPIVAPDQLIDAYHVIAAQPGSSIKLSVEYA